MSARASSRRLSHDSAPQPARTRKRRGHPQWIQEAKEPLPKGRSKVSVRVVTTTACRQVPVQVILEGGLVGLDLPEDEAKSYPGRIKEGGILLCVHSDDSERTDRAKKILDLTGAKLWPCTRGDSDSEVQIAKPSRSDGPTLPVLCSPLFGIVTIVGSRNASPLRLHRVRGCAWGCGSQMVDSTTLQGFV